MKKISFVVLMLMGASVFAVEASSTSTSSVSAIKRLEDQHERELLAKMEERDATRIDEAKDKTPECRFWKLQLKQGSSQKAATKVKEYCSSKALASNK